jgi:hypothetical protein
VSMAFCAITRGDDAVSFYAIILNQYSYRYLACLDLSFHALECHFHVSIIICPLISYVILQATDCSKHIADRSDFAVTIACPP